MSKLKVNNVIGKSLTKRKRFFKNITVMKTGRQLRVVDVWGELTGGGAVEVPM